MTKSTKPYPGQGAFVVLTKVDTTTWCVYRGANSMEAARKARRELGHYPADMVHIVENKAGEPEKFGLTTYYR